MWIRRYHQAPDSPVRLVCFPHAGGSASFFFPVAKALAPAIDVTAVQYPGRQDRRTEPNIDNIADLADAILPAVRPLTDRPLAFFGHSMGAILAYEVALRLEKDGAAPLTRLYASGRRAPSRYREETVHKRDDAGVIAELRGLSGTDADLLGDAETLEMILPAINATLGNQIDLLATTLGGGAAAQIKAGKLKGLGIAAAKRAAVVPDVPTYAEQGFGDFSAASWVGVFAPAKTDPKIVATLNEAFLDTIKSPTVQKRLTDIGFDPLSLKQPEAQAMFKSEVDKWGHMVKVLGLSVK